MDVDFYIGPIHIRGERIVLVTITAKESWRVKLQRNVFYVKCVCVCVFHREFDFHSVSRIGHLLLDRLQISQTAGYFAT